jgi:two-component system chemotaxis response regulator CheB
MATRDTIVIGGSTGSGEVLRKLLGALPADLPASLCITTHVPANAPGFLAEVLQRGSGLPVGYAIDGQPLEKGRVYLARPDRHLLLLDGALRLGEGPRENMVRPSIDPMFRSAALSYGSRTIGVVLTGMLNDGASGLNAIKSCGGLAVVQHPLDALADEMPLAALEAAQVDEVATASELGSVITALVATEAPPSPPPPSNLELEVAIAAGARLGSEQLREIADPAALICPDCGGVLSEVREEKPLRYRCQIGHAHTADVLAGQTRGVNEALGVALRVMEERVELVSRMARDAREGGRKAVAELYEARGAEYSNYAATLRRAAAASLRSMRATNPKAD